MKLVGLSAAVLCLALGVATPSMALADEPRESITQANAADPVQPAPRDVALVTAPTADSPLPLMKQIQRQVTRQLQRRVDADAKLLVEQQLLKRSPAAQE